MIKGNKGEWSEFYAFLKILSDKKLFDADEDLNQLRDKFHVVLQIIKDEARYGKKIYDISEGKDTIKIMNKDGDIIKIIDDSLIKSKIKELFSEMKNSKDTTFSIELGEKLMKEVDCNQIKACSASKADLVVVVHDKMSPVLPKLGFSIKSMLGSPATLLNPGKTTNFIYKIENAPNNLEDINKIETTAKVKDRIHAILNAGGKLVFKEMTNTTFKGNLRKIDTILPDIVAEMLKVFYSGEAATIADVLNRIGGDEDLKLRFDLTKNNLAYKIKEFLIAIALGMTPSHEWDGTMSAQGGYLIVKEDGEIVCYHLYNRDAFKDYLFDNTKMETASTTRYEFAKIYKENGEFYIKLNLQIRFIK